MCREITRISSLILRAAQDQLPVAHPSYPGVGMTISQLFGPPENDQTDGKNAVTVAGGEVDFDNLSSWIGALDRCPGGTGLCVRMAAMYAKGQLKLGELFRQEGLLNVYYSGHLIEETKVGDYTAVVPTITGQSWICGFHTLVFDPTDPFTEGFTIGDIWA